MQKYFISLLGFLFSMSPCVYSSYGFYVGGSGTATYWDFDVTNDVSVEFKPSLMLPPMSGSTDALSHDDTFYSVEGRFGLYMFAGQAEHWLVAVEGFAGPENADFQKTAAVFGYGTESKTINVTQTIETRYSYGGQLKLGYFFANKWLGYGLAGALNTFYQLDTSVGASQQGISAGPILATDVIHTGGFRFGGGLEKFWDNQLSLTLQATYNLYEKLNIFYENTISSSSIELGDAETATDAVKFDPSAFQVSLGLNYYFGI